MLKQQSATNSSSSVGAQSSGLTMEMLSKFAPGLAEDYPFILNMYNVPPRDEITLAEFETFAIDRLRVLRALENARLRCKQEETIAKMVEPVIAKALDMKRNTMVRSLGEKVLYEQRRKDHLSHFILRLAYCRSEDLRQWFVKQETALFKYRFSIEQMSERDAFIRHSQLDFSPVSIDDMVSERMAITTGSMSRKDMVMRMISDVRATYLNLTDVDPSRIGVFYRVPFEQVAELVGRRAVLVINGFAFVPENERSVLVVTAFKDKLMESLIATSKALPRLDEDERILPVLNSLARQYLSKEYNSATLLNGQVRHDDVDGLSTHFPPCMHQLHESLRTNSHLKHFGRLQFGLFLKGIGLPVEEALIFWRKAFNRMTDDEFNKKGYPYNIRYNYGMEGKRTNYTPYSCVKIITSNAPGPGDSHGCPFKHFSPEGLGTMLRRMRVTEPGIQEVLKITRDGHFQIACTRLFELTNGRAHALANDAMQSGVLRDDSALLETIEHPNQYYDLSFKRSGKHVNEK